jgi:hypothetical protein
MGSALHQAFEDKEQHGRENCGACLPESASGIKNESLVFTFPSNEDGNPCSGYVSNTLVDYWLVARHETGTTVRGELTPRPEAGHFRFIIHPI